MFSHKIHDSRIFHHRAHTMTCSLLLLQKLAILRVTYFLQMLYSPENGMLLTCYRPISHHLLFENPLINKDHLLYFCCHA